MEQEESLVSSPTTLPQPLAQGSTEAASPVSSISSNSLPSEQQNDESCKLTVAVEEENSEVNSLTSTSSTDDSVCLLPESSHSQYLSEEESLSAVPSASSQETVEVVSATHKKDSPDSYQQHEPGMKEKGEEEKKVEEEEEGEGEVNSDDVGLSRGDASTHSQRVDHERQPPGEEKDEEQEEDRESIDHKESSTSASAEHRSTLNSGPTSSDPSFSSEPQQAHRLPTIEGLTHSTQEEGIPFIGINYLGSSTVDAPVSETEANRKMSVLKSQAGQSIPIILSVPHHNGGSIVLKDPQSNQIMVAFLVRHVLFCARGHVSSELCDCFAINVLHKRSSVYHCHVFQCDIADAVSNVCVCVCVCEVHLSTCSMFVSVHSPLQCQKVFESIGQAFKHKVHCCTMQYIYTHVLPYSTCIMTLH